MLGLQGAEVMYSWYTRLLCGCRVCRREWWCGDRLGGIGRGGEDRTKSE
jgi:hypothetical protein